MIKISFPDYPFKIKEEDNKEYIFDPLRKCWARLSPEEWVRQNFVQYLLLVEQYPMALIAIEKELRLGELVKRFDILVYNKAHQPWLMIECKAMDIPLSDKVLSQVLRYNISIPVNYLVITNGSYTAAFEKRGGNLEMIEGLPEIM